MEFDLSFPLDLEVDTCVHEESKSLFESISEENIVPKTGIFLGLDISKDSTGVCLYKDGQKTTANISIVDYDKKDPHAETRARIDLQKDLLELFSIMGDLKSLDVVVIEDVFEGVNPATTRLLYALNTAIDELILWGKIECKEFQRVSNQTWKMWLCAADNSGGDLKGLNDKVKVQRVLEQLGVREYGAGSQDRLDATGMLLGYFIHKSMDAGVNSSGKKSSIRVQFSDIEYAFEEDEDLIRIAALGDNDGITTVIIDDSKISKKKMIDYLSSNLDVVFITSKPIILGILSKDLGLHLLPGQGGYFGFWLKDKAKKRYLKKLEVQ